MMQNKYNSCFFLPLNRALQCRGPYEGDFTSLFFKGSLKEGNFHFQSWDQCSWRQISLVTIVAKKDVNISCLFWLSYYSSWEDWAKGGVFKWKGGLLCAMYELCRSPFTVLFLLLTLRQELVLLCSFIPLKIEK